MNIFFILEYDVVYFGCEERRIMYENVAFYARSPKLRIATIRLFVCVFAFVRQSVRIEQLGSHSTDFHEI